ncbi:zinc finger BED domain-containing protein DAYSLEEPER-like isoform X2 [Mangifera indica]|uniref:zinc finger BED domain-containing protein DAYSLEEPER-like isoform X2 n=1 Tax=Mangifera indica TaxID=29780 RepID=UPI001CFA955A|nr:zinc finger BED domain-containing protein DAYSLEEPER-like isoform X2 [Mangifera indica]
MIGVFVYIIAQVFGVAWIILSSIEMDSPIAAVMPTPIDNSEPPGLETQPNKRSRKKSIVWDYFTVETVGAGCTRACCKQCKKSFAYITGSKLAGTSHLKRHITMGICPVSRQKNQQSPNSKPGNAIDPPKRRYRSTAGFASIPFNQDRCSHEIAKMIIMNDYPPHIVEHSGFVDFAHTLQPQFNMASFNTIQGDCVAMYLREKQSLLNFISEIPGRVNLTLDLWTSNQTIGYAVLTGYFIDGDWNLHRRILNVVIIPYPDSDVAFNQALATCLSDWHLESKLLTLALDHSFSYETLNQHLKNPLMLNGRLLIGNCYACVISRLAQDAIGATGAAVKKIRDSVKYVKTSDAHEEKFLELKEQLRVPSTKELFIDNQTKWNTTFHMLLAANELKQVFSCLETYDPDYQIVPPSMDEWKQAEILCIYLKYFFDAANILTSPTYPTASAFYHEVSKIQLELMQAAMSEDPFVSYLTRPLREKFDEYWRECFLVLAIAVVIDPRFKMNLIECSFSRIYGENAEMWIKVVEDGIHDLFHEYLVQAFPPDAFMEEGNEVIPKTEIHQEQIPHEDTLLEEIPQEGIYHEGQPQEGNYQGHYQEGTHQGLAEELLSHGSQEMPLITIGDGLSDFEAYICEYAITQQSKSELDQYLEESVLPLSQEFDILDWWKLNQLRYPTLSKMASDILSVPFSTVSPDSVFDTSSKKMDDYRTSLHPVTLEALICAKDWYQYGSLSSEFTNSTVKMEL